MNDWRARCEDCRGIVPVYWHRLHTVEFQRTRNKRFINGVYQTHMLVTGRALCKKCILTRERTAVPI